MGIYTQSGENGKRGVGENYLNRMVCIPFCLPVAIFR